MVLKVMDIPLPELGFIQQISASSGIWCCMGDDIPID